VFVDVGAVIEAGVAGGDGFAERIVPFGSKTGAEVKSWVFGGGGAEGGVRFATVSGSRGAGDDGTKGERCTAEVL